MPRDLQQSDRNEMIIQDAISACTLVLYYRQPTTAERIGFQRASWVRKGKKTINRSAEARAQYGAAILTGIREGDFTAGQGADGKEIFISSDQSSPVFCPDWKEKVIATAGDLLMLLGMQVFEGSLQQLVKAVQAAAVESEEDPGCDEEDAEGETNIIPLEKTSNG